ncbi:MAG: hypothetical protein GWN01_01240 [Nitrosopumilaceae archaeon]|nr:hypothetical protein [Nitrosopumilaceae archaeon]NIU85984.1 hypothetical protein [Nitrosopumilaceae archaeon]NIX60203.1 hypothetical protein [Nitrosopumilaceae archaeon]
MSLEEVKPNSEDIEAHREEWEKYLELYRNVNTPEMQYRARAIQGLLEGTTYDYNGMNPA